MFNGNESGFGREIANNLEVSLQSAYGNLIAASKSDDFLPKMAAIFGGSGNLNRLQALTDTWVSGDFSQLPPIEILPTNLMNGANGAFSEVTRTIYLSSGYLSQSSSNPDPLTRGITGVLLEEIGHFVDTLINPGSDTAGDEGELFAATLMGLRLTSAEKLLINSEDDHSFVTIDNKAIAVEQSLTLPTITVKATDASATETNTGQTANPGQFTLTRTGNTAAALTLKYTLSGTATNGTDYSKLDGRVTFAPGSATALVNVKPIDDTVFEGTESVIINLATNNTYVLGANTNATITIKPYLETQGLPADYEFINRIIFKDTIAKYRTLDIDPSNPGNEGIKAPSGQIYRQFQFIDDPVSGFQAAGFISESGAPPVLVFNGTNPDERLGKDILDDLNAAGIGTNQFSNNIAKIQAFLDAANNFLKKNGIKQLVDITGYSLGGANAQQAVAYFTGKGYKFGSVVTLNSPGIPVAALANFNTKNVEKVTHYIVNSDLVSLAGQAYLPGDYRLVEWNTTGAESFFPFGDKHNTAGSGKFYLSNHLTPDDPSLPDIPQRNGIILTSNFISKDYLSNPSFSYWSKPTEDWLSTNIVLGILSGGVIPTLLSTRATVESSRALLGTLLAPAIELLTTKNPANFAVKLAKVIFENPQVISEIAKNVNGDLRGVETWDSSDWGVFTAKTLFTKLNVGLPNVAKLLFNEFSTGLIDVAKVLRNELGAGLVEITNSLLSLPGINIFETAKALYSSSGLNLNLAQTASTLIGAKGIYETAKAFYSSSGLNRNLAQTASTLIGAKGIYETAKALYSSSGLDLNLTQTAQGLWDAGDNNRAKIASALWNMGVGGFGFKDVARALYDGTGGGLAGVVYGLWNGGIDVNRADIAAALWNMGVGGFGLSNVARALYDQTGSDLRQLALALWNMGVAGFTMTDIASAIWNMGVGGISKGNIVDALVYGIGGINLASAWAIVNPF